MTALCQAHKREADAWASGVQDLAQHPTMRPLDDGRHTDRTAGRNAIQTAQQQIGLIRSACDETRGCA